MSHSAVSRHVPAVHVAVAVRDVTATQRPNRLQSVWYTLHVLTEAEKAALECSEHRVFKVKYKQPVNKVSKVILIHTYIYM